MPAARRALRGAAGMTDRSCSLERMVRRCGHFVGVSSLVIPVVKKFDSLGKS